MDEREKADFEAMKAATHATERLATALAILMVRRSDDRQAAMERLRLLSLDSNPPKDANPLAKATREALEEILAHVEHDGTQDP